MLKRQPHDIEIKVDPKKKLKAIQHYKSQIGIEGPFGEFSARAVKQLLSKEYFSFVQRSQK